jgi:Tol biopolymer transport system component
LAGSVSGPDWSPDGKSLVFVKWRRNRPDSLLLHSLEGKKDQELSSELVTNFAQPRWSLKGDAILVIATRIDNGDRVVAVFNVSTAELKIVAQNSPNNGGLGGVEWSADGTKVMYRMGGRLSVLQDLATGVQKTIAAYPWVNGTGDFSRDGRMLVVPIANARALDIIDIEHAEQHELVHFKQTQGIGSWSWSPDGQSVFVVMIHDYRVRSIDQTSELYRVPVDGGELKSLGRFNGVVQSPRIDPAGRRIAYSINQPGPTEVWALENLAP